MTLNAFKWHNTKECCCLRDKYLLPTDQNWIHSLLFSTHVKAITVKFHFRITDVVTSLLNAHTHFTDVDLQNSTIQAMSLDHIVPREGKARVQMLWARTTALWMYRMSFFLPWCNLHVTNDAYLPPINHSKHRHWPMPRTKPWLIYACTTMEPYITAT